MIDANEFDALDYESDSFNFDVLTSYQARVLSRLPEEEAFCSVDAAYDVLCGFFDNDSSAVPLDLAIDFADATNDKLNEMIAARAALQP